MKLLESFKNKIKAEEINLDYISCWIALVVMLSVALGGGILLGNIIWGLFLDSLM